jgi:hypothetical protein
MNGLPIVKKLCDAGLQAELLLAPRLRNYTPPVEGFLQVAEPWLARQRAGFG